MKKKPQPIHIDHVRELFEQLDAGEQLQLVAEFIRRQDKDRGEEVLEEIADHVYIKFHEDELHDGVPLDEVIEGMKAKDMA